MIAIALGVALAVVAIYIFKKKKHLPIDPQAIRREAHAEATAALAKLDDESPREAAIQSSMVLRKYLAAAAGDPALFETHEEYVSRHHALKNYSAESRQAAGLGFTRLAALKYATDIPATHTREVVTDSQALLETLHLGFQA